jgi:hypothetical protein
MAARSRKHTENGEKPQGFSSFCQYGKSAHAAGACRDHASKAYPAQLSGLADEKVIRQDLIVFNY